MKSNVPLRTIGRAMAIVSTLVYIAAVYMVIKTQLLPVKYLVVAISATAVIAAAILTASYAKKVSSFMRLAMIGLSLAMIAASLYVILISQTTTSFLDGIQEREYSYIDYSVIAEKNRHITLGRAELAGMLPDPNQKEVTQELKKRTAATDKMYDDPTSLIVGLEADETEIALINNSYLQLLRDNHQGFEQNIEILATFRIKIRQQASQPVADVSQPFIVYVSGIDTYGPIASVSRSDVNILAVVNPITHEILLVNTPRDYYVQLHGTSGIRDKLTHAGIYGIDMSRQTLEDLYATKIDYYLRVNFTSLVDLVDTLGGVEVNSDYAFKSFQQGANQLNGKQALEFSRERYSFSEGDRQRGRNQQKVMEAIIAKASQPSSIIHYRTIISVLENSIQTNLSKSSASNLVNTQLDTMKSWHVESISVDGSGATARTYSMGSLPLYVMEPDQASLDIAKAKINSTLSQR